LNNHLPSISFAFLNFIKKNFTLFNFSSLKSFEKNLDFVLGIFTIIVKNLPIWILQF